jgi:hypothetical protein
MIVAMSSLALPAFSARLMQFKITGTVSAVSGNQIVVDGKSYSVKVDGPALRQLQRVQVGQTIDLVLNGSAASSASQVTAVHVHGEEQEHAGHRRGSAVQ